MTIFRFDSGDLVHLIAPALLLLWALREHLKLQELEYDRGDLTEDGVIYRFSAAPDVWERLLEEKVRGTNAKIWGCIFAAGCTLFGPSFFLWFKALL